MPASAGRPNLVILCGLPGCGKSTFAMALEERLGYIRVTPDDIGALDECKKMMAKAMKHGRDVVLDRVNASDKERKMFIRELQEYHPKVSVVFFDLPPDFCVQRAMSRKAHPTLAPENVQEVVTMFQKTFRPPARLSEGPYDAMHVCASEEEAKALLLRFLNRELP